MKRIAIGLLTVATLALSSTGAAELSISGVERSLLDPLVEFRDQLLQALQVLPQPGFRIFVRVIQDAQWAMPPAVMDDA